MNWIRLPAVIICLFMALPSLAVKGDPDSAARGWALISEGALLIDVRSAEEFAAGHVNGAMNVPHSDTAGLAAAIGADKDRSVVVYCGSGRRAGKAKEALEALGYTAVFNATGYGALEATQPQP